MDQPYRPRHRAALTGTVTFVPGVDRNELAVTDENGDRVAATSWQPMTPGVASWDAELAGLGYARSGDWRPTEGGFRCNVEPADEVQ